MSVKRQPKRMRVRANWPPVLRVRGVRLVGDPLPYNSTQANRQEGASPVRDVQACRCVLRRVRGSRACR